MNNKAQILLYQELSSNAWPAKTYISLHGWVLRLSEGVTKRANSVLPLRYTGQDLLKDVKTVEKIYKEKSLPVIFQLPDYCEPSNLQETLLSLGYVNTDETLVMASEIEDIHTITNKGYTYSLGNKGVDCWFHALADFSHYSRKSLEGRKTIMRRIPLSKVFCCARQADKIIGVGLGVIEREYLGVYSLAVSPDYHRKGIGQSIVAQMVQWGRSHSAVHVYLQVQGDNSGAISFYRKIGFDELYRYRYFII